MENKFELLNEVYDNQSKYPPCIVSKVNYLISRKIENKNACKTIRSKYKDIWSDYIKKPKGRIQKMNYSMFLNNKYGRTRMSEFHSLKEKTNNTWNNILRYDLICIIHEIKLTKFTKNELSEFLINLSNYIEHNKDIDVVDKKYRNFVIYVTPLRLSEIVLFLLVNNEY